MTIPDFQTLMRPILSYLVDGQPRSTRTVTDAMFDEYGLTAQEPNYPRGHRLGTLIRNVHRRDNMPPSANR
jgi:hypothetical protein